MTILSIWSQSNFNSATQEYDLCFEKKDSSCLIEFLGSISEIKFDSSGIIQILDFGNTVQLESGLDKSRLIFNFAIKQAEELDNEKLISDGLTELASIELLRGNLNEAQSIYMEAKRKALISGDRYTITKSKINLGHVFRKKGDIDSSAFYYRQGILNLEEEKNFEKIGYPYMYLGILYGVNGDRAKSVENFKISYDYFNKVIDTTMTATVAVNIANTYMSMNKLDSSEYFLREAIPRFTKLKDTRSLLNAESQLGRLYLYQGKWELANNLIQKATQKAITLDLKPQIVYNYRLLSEAYLAQNNYKEALDAIFNALDICKETGFDQEYPRILKLISKIYFTKGDYRNAYSYEKEGNLMEDSIFSEKKKLKIDELEAKFENEKKEKKIAKLNEETIKAKLKKTQLLWSISIITISLLSFIGLLVFKQRKNKQLLEKERDVEIAQRKTIELENTILVNELELKKKELVSSALLISKKNSFLEMLKQKVETKDSKLQNLIHHELASENEWKNFIDVFNSTHGSFVSNLNKVHDSLSVTEKRLACLIKMNMSSKEIASVLNISYEGVKKAKYRLKKKLRIQEGIDLIGYLNMI